MSYLSHLIDGHFFVLQVNQVLHEIEEAFIKDGTFSGRQERHDTKPNRYNELLEKTVKSLVKVLEPVLKLKAERAGLFIGCLLIAVQDPDVAKLSEDLGYQIGSD